ncbi:MAG TPA: hypothetical protein VFN73_04630 [Propionibacteriaceae bacterium]|nr:hypothetical protein [Propionibacteriaceae bacterium]
MGWHSVFSSYSAYNLIRPLGASVADGLAEPNMGGGPGFGDALLVAVIGALIVALVASLTLTGRDVRPGNDEMEVPHARAATAETNYLSQVPGPM